MRQVKRNKSDPNGDPKLTRLSAAVLCVLALALIITSPTSNSMLLRRRQWGDNATLFLATSRTHSAQLIKKFFLQHQLMNNEKRQDIQQDIPQTEIVTRFMKERNHSMDGPPSPRERNSFLPRSFPPSCADHPGEVLLYSSTILSLRTTSNRVPISRKRGNYVQSFLLIPDPSVQLACRLESTACVVTASLVILGKRRNSSLNHSGKDKNKRVLSTSNPYLNKYLHDVVGPDSFTAIATLSEKGKGGELEQRFVTCGAVRHCFIGARENEIEEIQQRYNVSFEFSLKQQQGTTAKSFGIEAKVRWDYTNYDAVDEEESTIMYSPNVALGTVWWESTLGQNVRLDKMPSSTEKTRLVPSTNPSVRDCCCGSRDGALYPIVQFRQVVDKNGAQPIPRRRRLFQGSQFQMQVSGRDIPNEFSHDAVDAITRHFMALNGDKNVHRTVMFVGDSQVRVLFRHWTASLHKSMPVLHKTFNATDELFINTSTIHTIRITSHYLWDPYLNQTLGRLGVPYITSMLKRGDLLVLGIGSWPASYGQWSFAQFDNRLRSVQEKVLNPLVVEFGVKVVYADSPAFPKWRKNPGFRISNYRLILMNHIARQALLLPGANIFAPQEDEVTPALGDVRPSSYYYLPYFHLSLPFPKYAKDGIHYSHSVVVYSAVDWLWSQVVVQ